MWFIATVTLTVGMLALWSLRHTWGAPWDRPATINVVLLTLDVFLAHGQVGRWFSPKLHTLTGVWNLEQLVGHVCVVAGMCCLLYLVAGRLDMSTAQLGWFVRHRIELPATIAIAGMVALFLAGDLGGRRIADMTGAEVTPWLRAYWLVMIVVCYYLIWNIGRVLLILRRDPRSRRAATAYLVAVGVSAVCGLSFVVAAEPLQWLMVRLEVVGYALAASYTWHSKLAYLKGR